MLETRSRPVARGRAGRTRWAPRIERAGLGKRNPNFRRTEWTLSAPGVTIVLIDQVCLS